MSGILGQYDVKYKDQSSSKAFEAILRNLEETQSIDYLPEADEDDPQTRAVPSRDVASIAMAEDPHLSLAKTGKKKRYSLRRLWV